MDRIGFRGIRVDSEGVSMAIDRNTVLSGIVLGVESKENAKTTVTMTYKNGESAVLCTLIPNVTESIIANLLVRAGEQFTLKTNNTNEVYVTVTETEKEKGYETYDGPMSLNIVRIKENERVLLTGSVVYTLGTLATSSKNKRVSLCSMINGSEVTIANFVPGRIETVELALETYENDEIELFVVGEGEVDIVGYIDIDEEYNEEYECEACDGEGCEECEEESTEEEINDNEMISDERLEHVVNNENRKRQKKENETETKSNNNAKKHKHVTISSEVKEEDNTETKRTKEEIKQEKREKEKSMLVITDIRKSDAKNKAVAHKTDTVRIRYTLRVNDKVVEKSKHAGIVFAMGENKMIRGLELGIEGMCVGDIRSIKIPPSLGYGSKRVGNIAPDSTLLFHVELIAADKK